MSILTLIRNADIYTPAPWGRGDLLLAGQTIAAMGSSLAHYAQLPEVEVVDLGGARLAPAYIDLHVHVTGGGGEQGFPSRVREIELGELVTAGVTTVVGLLGTDSVTRSLEALVAKTAALNAEGITAYMLTGAYAYPSPTLCGDVMRDIALLERVIGVKVALADHRSSHLSSAELLRLGSEARLGGLVSGKPGLVTIHMGDGKDGLAKLYEVLEQSDLPITTYLPTHMSRNPQLAEESVRYTRMGGYADFTAGEEAERGYTAGLLVEAMQRGADPERLTVSSDSCGSQPRFDAAGRCVGLTYTKPAILHEELKLLVQAQGLPLETALRFFTSNPAAVLQQSACKGTIQVGADADLLVYDDDLEISRVYARGKLAALDGKPLIKGRFA